MFVFRKIAFFAKYNSRSFYHLELQWNSYHALIFIIQGYYYSMFRVIKKNNTERGSQRKLITASFLLPEIFKISQECLKYSLLILSAYKLM